jgi:murein DD-endopeptidase MepM/ murein hydrolase activator NlpD
VQSIKFPLPLLTSQKDDYDHQIDQNPSLEVTVLVFVRPNENPSTFKKLHLLQKTQTRILNKSGKFDGNFFNVMDRNNIPDSVSNQFVRVFSSYVNFSNDLMHQARFNMKYEVIYFEDYPIAFGKVLYASLSTLSTEIKAYWWKSANNKGSYYSPEGEILASLSWKSPILYSRKTSNFGYRIDPFIGSIANHQGIDIGAPLGTEVRATQLGTVKFYGYRSSYGKVVFIDHGNGYETIYGHLSGFAQIRKGQYIPQGELLGFVGNTGRSTGPHLHYELRKEGIAINPEQSFKSINLNTHNTRLDEEELKQFVKFQNSVNESLFN